MERNFYSIDGENGEMLFVGGNRHPDGVQLAFGNMDYAKKNAGKYSMMNFLIVQTGTIANILEAYEEGDEEERREIELELIDLLEEPGGYVAN